MRGVQRPGVVPDDYRLNVPFWRLLPGVPATVDVLRVRHIGRFGNHVTQLKHAGYWAERLDSTLIAFDGAQEPFAGGDTPTGKLVFDKISGGTSDPFLRGTFFTGATLGLQLSGQEHKRLVETYVKPFIQPEVLAGDPRVEPDDLVMHFRSGDIMVPPSPHPDYGQPPAAFYMKAFHGTSASRVWLVYEDDANPVIGSVAEQLEREGVTVLRQSASFAEDLGVLLAARVLVASHGTLCPALAEVSGHLTRYFSFHEFPDHPLSTLSATGVEVTCVIDEQRTYVSALMDRNWAATPEQLDLMLSYPRESLATR